MSQTARKMLEEALDLLADARHLLRQEAWAALQVGRVEDAIGARGDDHEIGEAAGIMERVLENHKEKVGA